MVGKGEKAATGKPQFVCDAMLGGLARWLRAAGYSAEFDVHIKDGEIVRRCLSEGKVILTSDSDIMDRYAVSRDLVTTVFVPTGLSPVMQLAHVMRELGLALRPSRCMDCNGELRDAPLEEVAGEVPEKVLRWCKGFFRCCGCGKVFWHGTHWRSISARLRKASELSCGTREG